MNIVLLGAPGAGKDTLAYQMHDIYGFKVLTTGALYREEKEAQTELGLRAYSYWGSGNLCPDDMTNELMQTVVSKINPGTALIFNGYPRTADQASFLEELAEIKLAINIKVDEDIAVKRMMARGRKGETPEVIKQRLNVYYKTGVLVRDFYNHSHRLIEVDGNRTPEETFAKVFHSVLEVVHI